MEAVRRASANLENLDSACLELKEKLEPENASLVLLFASSMVDLDLLNGKIAQSKAMSVVACTTSGEISTNGFAKKSLAAIAFDKSHFLTDQFVIPDLANVNGEDFSKLKNDLDATRKKHRHWKPNAKSFAIILLDGLSQKEEEVTAVLEDVLKGVPLIGASAGDDLKFKETKVYSNGALASNTGVLIYLTTDIPFETFKVDHFFTSKQNLVITDADPDKRIVYEIDGYPAAEGYARALGLKVEQLSPEVFSKHPVMLNVGEEHYIRSIQQVTPEGALVFYCAIEVGVVLQLANSYDLQDEMKKFFNNMNEKLGNDKVCLLFECILRRLEIESLPAEKKKQIEELYSKNNAIGFHTYGEQYCGLHINQTLTGVAFGKAVA